jgi:uncharacterized membrane protein
LKLFDEVRKFSSRFSKLSILFTVVVVVVVIILIFVVLIFVVLIFVVVVVVFVIAYARIVRKDGYPFEQMKLRVWSSLNEVPYYFVNLSTVGIVDQANLHKKIKRTCRSNSQLYRD